MINKNDIRSFEWYTMPSEASAIFAALGYSSCRQRFHTNDLIMFDDEFKNIFADPERIENIILGLCATLLLAGYFLFLIH